MAYRKDYEFGFEQPFVAERPPKGTFQDERAPRKAPCFKHNYKAYSEGTRNRVKVVLKCSNCGHRTDD